ncbi:MAG TPA: hypothetical protein VFU63_03710 [Ktedonobacterales bacterium]|nr:hypothetical protein [Ktedonobacterales bacterium]
MRRNHAGSTPAAPWVATATAMAIGSGGTTVYTASYDASGTITCRAPGTHTL